MTTIALYVLLYVSIGLLGFFLEDRLDTCERGNSPDEKAKLFLAWIFIWPLGIAYHLAPIFSAIKDKTFGAWTKFSDLVGHISQYNCKYQPKSQLEQEYFNR